MKEHFDTFIELNGMVMAVFGVGIFGGLSAIFATLRKNYRENQRKNETLNEIVKSQKIVLERIESLEHQGALRQDANIASLHASIYTNYEIILSRNPPAVTMKELSNLGYLWRAYNGLGGNGTGEKMYNRILNLPILDESEEY